MVYRRNVVVNGEIVTPEVSATVSIDVQLPSATGAPLKTMESAAPVDPTREATSWGTDDRHSRGTARRNIPHRHSRRIQVVLELGQYWLPALRLQHWLLPAAGALLEYQWYYHGIVIHMW
jgi:hypothetical protein